MKVDFDQTKKIRVQRERLNSFLKPRVRIDCAMVVRPGIEPENAIPSTHDFTLTKGVLYQLHWVNEARVYFWRVCTHLYSTSNGWYFPRTSLSSTTSSKSLGKQAISGIFAVFKSHIIPQTWSFDFINAQNAQICPGWPYFLSENLFTYLKTTMNSLIIIEIWDKFDKFSRHPIEPLSKCFGR